MSPETIECSRLGQYNDGVSSRSILIVEDDQAIRESLQELLEGEGYSVDTAIHGQDALSKLKSAKELPGVILLDLMMPVMNGHEFIAEWQKAKPAANAPAVVVITAARDDVPPSVDGILKKPIELDTLLEAVRRYCSA